MEKYLADNKRFHWPTMEHNDSEAVTTENEVDLPSASSLSTVRSSQLSKRKLIKTSRDANHEQLLKAHPLFGEDISTKILRERESQPACETEDGRNTHVLNENKRLSALVEDLTSRLNDRDEKLHKYQNIETNINNMLKSLHEAAEKSEKNIEDKLENKLSELNEIYDVRLTQLEEKLNQFSAEETENLMRDLPVYLGDIAYTMDEKRSTAVKTDDVEVGGQNENAGVKRKYVKKGDFAAGLKPIPPPPRPPLLQEQQIPTRPPPPAQEEQIQTHQPPPAQEQQIPPRPPPLQERQRQHLQPVLPTSPPPQPDLTDLQVSSYWRNAESSNANGVSTNIGEMLTSYFADINP